MFLEIYRLLNEEKRIGYQKTVFRRSRGVGLSNPLLVKEEKKDLPVEMLSRCQERGVTMECRIESVALLALRPSSKPPTSLDSISRR
jgi:hypothetical protein